VSTRDNPIFARPLAALVFAVTAFTLVASAPASAQNFFEALFGIRPYTPASGSSYADPQSRFGGLFGSRESPRQSENGAGAGGVAYCVRLCDGRQFPMQRSSGASSAQVCSSFCPAAKTKIFSGSSIEHAVATDGSRYADLPNAFLYRTRLLSDCTCNGKDPVGLVTPATDDDPTLRAGDIVASESGLMAYTGSGRRGAEFTPVEAYSPLGSELRSRLAGVKIVPNTATPVPVAARPADDTKAADAKAAAKPARSTANRRVQLER
jgi:hypothetical protein